MRWLALPYYFILSQAKPPFLLLKFIDYNASIFFLGCLKEKSKRYRKTICFA